VSTDDSRPQAGGYSDTYSSTPQGAGSSSFFDDDDYSSAQTTVLPGSSYDAPPDSDNTDTVDETPTRRSPEWHRGLDFGLLVLRLAIGAFFVAHGTDKLFGWFNDGMGMEGTRQLLSGYGFTEVGTLAWVTALSETVGGVLVILGLFFPAGAAALLGVMANVIVVKGDWNLFLGDVELEMTYAVAAFALLFTGPGRFALDRHTHWWRRAPVYGFVFLIIAAGLTVVTLVVFR